MRELIEDNIRERHFEVDVNFRGWRLDRFLANRLGRISRDRANEIVKHGDITLVPERRVKPSLKLRQGDVVIVREHLEAERVQDAEVTILHEDDDLIILNKPPGMLVHETARTRLNTIQWYLRRQGHEDAEPVHRIDRDTSGVLVCVKRAELIPQMRELFATAHPTKVYRALVHDPEDLWPEGTRRTLTQPLGLIRTQRLDLRMGQGALACTTHVRALGALEHARGALRDLRVEIETGRQHQIRVHLYLYGTPIAGDKLYGKTDDFFIAICDRPEDPELLAELTFPRHALHAWRMSFPHPTSGDPVTFEAPLPPALWGNLST